LLDFRFELPESLLLNTGIPSSSDVTSSSDFPTFRIKLDMARLMIDVHSKIDLLLINNEPNNIRVANIIFDSIAL
jgi:hypothetical protein